MRIEKINDILNWIELSILSFGKITVDIKSSADIKILEILSKLAKEVVIDVTKTNYYIENNEFKPDFKVNQT